MSCLQPHREDRQVETGGGSGVGPEGQRPSGVADQRDPATGRSGLPVEQEADIDQFLHRAHPHDAGVGEQRIDDLIG